MACTHLKDRQPAPALAALQEAVGVDPSVAEYHDTLGLVLLELGRPDMALPEFQKAVEIDPKSADAQFHLGTAYAETGRWEDAVGAYRKALALPTLAVPDFVHQNLGLALYHLRRYPEAESSLRFALSLDPQMQAAYYNLGLVLVAENRSEEAKAGLSPGAKSRSQYALWSSGFGATEVAGRGWLNQWGAPSEKGRFFLTLFAPTRYNRLVVPSYLPASVGDVALHRGGSETHPQLRRQCMRRMVLAAVLAVAMLAMLVPPAMAQTPKVTITGLFDQVMSVGKNYSESNFSRDSDQEWYARTRFRPDFTFEVGRVKAVMGLELDLTYGQVGSCGGGQRQEPVAHTIGCSRLTRAPRSDAGLNTDTAGIIEIKWMYTEFPLTGKDSVMPFIPIETMARAGLQPFASIATYKNTYASGDFAGLSTKTDLRSEPSHELRLRHGRGRERWRQPRNRGAPSVPAHRSGKPTRGNDFAIITSPEFTPFKGLDIKPLYSLFYAEGTTSGTARRGAVDRHLNARRWW